MKKQKTNRVFINPRFERSQIPSDVETNTPERRYTYARAQNFSVNSKISIAEILIFKRAERFVTRALAESRNLTLSALNSNARDIHAGVGIISCYTRQGSVIFFMKTWMRRERVFIIEKLRERETFALYTHLRMFIFIAVLSLFSFSVCLLPLSRLR